MIYTAVDNFYLSDAELANSPSRGDGVDEETETTLRVLGAELIQEAGILLGSPQAVMATGQILLQRFYCKKSLKQFNIRRMAPACLFMSAKLEEWQDRPRLLRDVIMVFDRIMKRRQGRTLTMMDHGSKDYIDFKNDIIRFEMRLLKTFGFIVHAQHPHSFVVSYVRMLTGQEDDSPLFDHAWSICNDSLRTTLCVRFKPEVVACGAIFLAARRLKVPLPEAPAWWGVFSVATEQLIEAVCSLHALYQRPKAEYVNLSAADAEAPAAGKADAAIADASPAVVDGVTPVPEAVVSRSGGRDVSGSAAGGVEAAAAARSGSSAGGAQAGRADRGLVAEGGTAEDARGMAVGNGEATSVAQQDADGAAARPQGHTNNRNTAARNGHDVDRRPHDGGRRRDKERHVSSSRHRHEDDERDREGDRRYGRGVMSRSRSRSRERPPDGPDRDRRILPGRRDVEQRDGRRDRRDDGNGRDRVDRRDDGDGQYGRDRVDRQGGRDEDRRGGRDGAVREDGSRRGGAKTAALARDEEPTTGSGSRAGRERSRSRSRPRGRTEEVRASGRDAKRPRDVGTSHSEQQASAELGDPAKSAATGRAKAGSAGAVHAPAVATATGRAQAAPADDPSRVPVKRATRIAPPADGVVAVTATCVVLHHLSAANDDVDSKPATKPEQQQQRRHDRIDFSIKPTAQRDVAPGREQHRSKGSQPVGRDAKEGQQQDPQHQPQHLDKTKRTAALSSVPLVREQQQQHHNPVHENHNSKPPERQDAVLDREQQRHALATENNTSKPTERQHTVLHRGEQQQQQQHPHAATQGVSKPAERTSQSHAQQQRQRHVLDRDDGPAKRSTGAALNREPPPQQQERHFDGNQRPAKRTDDTASDRERQQQQQQQRHLLDVDSDDHRLAPRATTTTITKTLLDREQQQRQLDACRLATALLAKEIGGQNSPDGDASEERNDASQPAISPAATSDSALGNGSASADSRGLGGTSGGNKRGGGARIASPPQRHRGGDGGAEPVSIAGAGRPDAVRRHRGHDGAELASSVGGGRRDGWLDGRQDNGRAALLGHRSGGHRASGHKAP